MSNDARDTKHWTFLPRRSGKAPQPSPQIQEPFQQKPPVGNSPGEPVDDAAKQAFWLNRAFPDAAAREAQIRQAAQAVGGPDKPPPYRGGDEQVEPRTRRDATERPDPPRHGFTAEHGRRNDGFAAYRQRLADAPVPDEAARIPSERANTGLAAQRTQIAAEIAGTDDPRDLANLVRQELHLATFGMAVPGDKLAALQNELAARKPGNEAFREIVDQQSELAEAEWAAQGRTYEVFDPLVEADDAGDWQELEALLAGQFAFIASATPTAQAVEDHKLLLLTYGPHTGVFQTSVSRAAGLFLVERPQRDAAEIGKVLQREGLVAAAAKLRDLTDHEAADPLSAGQILNRSEKSIDEIASHFFSAALSSGAVHRGANAGAKASAGHSPASIASTTQSQIFSDLSAAADSASRSQQGLDAMKHLAGLLRDAPTDVFVTASIRNGGGIVLPLEIARLRLQNADNQGADELALLIQVGVQDLLEIACGAVREFDETSSLLMGPMTGEDAQTDGAQAGIAVKWEQADPKIVEDTDAQLAALNRYGYALARTMRSLEASRPWLDRLANHEALRRLGTLPDEKDFSELSFVLGAMPTSVAEALRRGDTGLPKAGRTGDTYLRVQDIAFAFQWFQGFRQFLATVRHKRGDDRPAQP